MKGNDSSVISVLIKSLLTVLLLAVLIFVCAGRLSYWQGQLYLALTFLSAIAAYLAVSDNPELIRERASPGKGMKSWDKVYWVLSTPMFFITIGLSAADAGRLRVSPLPLWVSLVAAAVYLTGQFVFLWAKHTNHYFSSVARIQKDRGQTVCREGPYRYIRHPGYLGGMLYTLATPFILGSFLGFWPTLFSVILLLIRTRLEDAMLYDELPGYKDYQTGVKHRLIPYLW